MYGTGKSAALTDIAVQSPNNRNQYELVKGLERQLGQPTQPKRTLTYNVSVSEANTVVSSSQELQRYQVSGSVSFSLINSEGQTVYQGQVSSFTNYSATGSTLATDRSQRDAEDRLMAILADRIVARLTLDVLK